MIRLTIFRRQQGTVCDFKCLHPSGAWGGHMRKKSKRLGQSFESLPKEQRARLYREMADAAFLKAQKAIDPTQRAEYLNMATSWHALAQEMEKTQEGLEHILPEQPEAGQSQESN